METWKHMETRRNSWVHKLFKPKLKIVEDEFINFKNAKNIISYYKKYC